MAFAEQQNLTLTVKVLGAKPNQGQAIVSVFNAKERFLKSPLRNEAQPIDSKGEVQFQLTQMSRGTYAVSVVYDEDQNNELNTGFMGIPTELVGFSNNAKGFMGPPSFEKASFVLSGDRVIEISLVKAGDED
jgi:uncharacterized protein (DUF2141 family)